MTIFSRITVFLLVALFCCNADSADNKTGKLVIAGGAISENSTIIFDKFAEFAGSKNARIGVIPAATGSVAKQYKLLQKVFTNAGVKSENIVLLPLAAKDDKQTNVNEASWSGNGNSKKVAEQVNQLTGIWFIGGDQTLITKVLLNQDGTDTLVLTSIRRAFKQGATIGGTSAGAAIMSNIMIAGGNSQGAIFEGFRNTYTSMDEQEYGPVSTAKGLNFFPSGIIDQHFDRKGRLGRLIVTLLNHPQFVRGFGVDEGTAMLVEDNQLSVIGEGGVTLVDVSKVQGFNVNQYPVSVKNIRLSHLQPGDQLDLNTLTFTSRTNASKTVGREYFKVPEQTVSGLVNANRNIDQFIGYDLLDNKATNSVSSFVIGENLGIKMTFSQDTFSQGYWSTDLTADVYSFENVKMDIKPIQINLTD